MWRNNREQLFPEAKTTPGRFGTTWRTPHAKWFTAYREGCKGWGVVAASVLNQPCAGVCRKPRSLSLGFQCGWPLVASICMLVLSLVQVCGKGRCGWGSREIVLVRWLKHSFCHGTGISVFNYNATLCLCFVPFGVLHCMCYGRGQTANGDVTQILHSSAIPS